jgi:Tol biopolymer transport system component
VVTKARLAISEYYSALYLRHMSGAGRKQIVGGGTFGPAWSPKGDQIAYWNASSLAVTDTLGNTSNLSTPGLYYVGWPEYSPDGSWIYFQGNSGYGTQVYRIHPDGTGMQPMLPSGTQGTNPSPSPDGTRFAFANAGLFVKTIGSQRIDTVVAPYTSVSLVRWSPDGQWIAYADDGQGALVLVRPDRSERRTIKTSVSGSISWSPDSKWLVGGAAGGLALIDVTLGKAYPLSLTGSYVAWHP